MVREHQGAIRAAEHTLFAALMSNVDGLFWGSLLYGQ